MHMQGGRANGWNSRTGSTRIVSIVVIGVTGLFVAMMATPSVRAIAIKRAITRADARYAVDQPERAAQILEQIQSWSDCYPILTPQVNTRLVRYYTAAGELPKAVAMAENVRRQQKGEEQIPSAAASTWIVFKPLEIVPNKIFNGVKQPMEFNSMQGYDALRQELNRLDRTDLLWSVGLQPAPAPQVVNNTTGPKHIKMKDLFPDQSDPGQKIQPEPVAKPDRAQSNKSASPDESESNGKDGSAPVAQPAKQPVADTQASEKALKVIRLKAQQQSLEAQIEKLVRLQPTPAAAQPVSSAHAALTARYNAAKQKYDKFVEQSIRMKTEMDKASGARRTELLDALKKRRFDEQPLKREMEKAKNDLERASGAPQIEAAKANERKIRELNQQLTDVRTELQSLEFAR